MGYDPSKVIWTCLRIREDFLVRVHVVGIHTDSDPRWDDMSVEIPWLQAIDSGNALDLTV